MQLIQYKTRRNLEVFTDNFNSVESVSIVIAIKAGGLYESAEEYGISHFLEHMAFKGTQNMNYREIALAFDRIGGSFNAYTTKDRTVFYAKVLKDNVYQALDLLAEILSDSTLPAEEIEKERKVILQEIAQNKDIPDNYIFDLYYESAYKGQPMGHDLLGSTDFVQNVHKDQLAAYMQKFYTADNIKIAISGNFDSDKVYNYIQEKFSKIPESNSSHFLPITKYTPGIIHKTQDIDQTHIIIGFEGVSYLDDQFYIQNVASMILGEGMSSRLFEQIREKQGLCYHITSFTGSYHDTGLFGVYSATHPNKIKQMSISILEELKKIADNVTDDELEIAKNQICSAILMSLESTTARAEKIASNQITFGRVIPIDEIRDRINSITKIEICEYFSKIILKSEPTFASIGKRVDESIYSLI